MRVSDQKTPWQALGLTLVCLTLGAIVGPRALAQAQNQPSWPTGMGSTADALTGAVTLLHRQSAATAQAGMDSAQVIASHRELLATGPMVVTAHPLATQAGITVLAQGGSAADAAVAIQAMLTLVEPQSSGFGGGGFALHWSAETLMLDSYDGRETAPLAAGGDLFLRADGTPLDFMAAVIGGRAVGTPGTLRLLERLHADHGRLDWPELLAPAQRSAEEGFSVTRRLHESIAASAGSLRDDPVAAAYFLTPEGEAWPVGHRLKNPDYASLLTRLMADGADAFYRGDIAEAIVAKVQSHPRNPGLLRLDDLARYQAVRRAPVCVLYRVYRVCGMGPPSSGGLTVGQILGMLDGYDLRGEGPDETRRRHHLYAEVAKRAYADRARYMADKDAVPVPVAALLDRDYLMQRAASVDVNAASVGPALAGDWPADQLGTRLGADPAQQDSGTSHFVVVDAAGNIISYTGSIESAFGARQMVHGILLNNQLTDFAFEPMAADGQPVANRVQPGKRPRSSMAPTIVFDGLANPILALGSPGGSRIINYVAMALVNMLDRGLTPAQAFAAGHIGSRNGALEVEQGAVPPSVIEALRAMGHEVEMVPMVSGLHGIALYGEQRLGGADPRREGHVAALP